VDPQPETPSIIGSIDVLRNGFVGGWAFDQSNPAEPLVIEVQLGEEILCRTRADEFRQDLIKLGNGEGRHAFHAAIAEVSPDQYPNVIVHARSTNTGRSIALAPGPQAFGGDPLVGDLRRVLPAINELKAQLRVLARGQEKLLAAFGGTSAKSPVPAKDATGSLANIEDMLGALSSTQTGLQEHATATEVFLMRFDKLLTDLDQRVTDLSRPKGLSLQRWTLSVSLIAIVLLVAGIFVMGFLTYWAH
jgi:hypothetical protein